MTNARTCRVAGGLAVRNYLRVRVWIGASELNNRSLLIGLLTSIPAYLLSHLLGRRFGRLSGLRFHGHRRYGDRGKHDFVQGRGLVDLLGTRAAQPVQKEHDGSGIDPARKESWIIQQHTGEVILFDFRHLSARRKPVEVAARQHARIQAKEP